MGQRCTQASGAEAKPGFRIYQADHLERCKSLTSPATSHPPFNHSNALLAPWLHPSARLNWPTQTFAAHVRVWCRHPELSSRILGSARNFLLYATPAVQASAKGSGFPGFEPTTRRQLRAQSSGSPATAPPSCWREQISSVSTS